jgi:hypothetical protein
VSGKGDRVGPSCQFTNWHAPGFWQELQGLPDGMGADFGEPAPTAKTDNCFSTFALRQAGHTGVISPRTRNSKRLPQSVQEYSNSGIAPV